MSVDLKDTLFNITEKHKEALDLLISLGFESLKDDNLRKMFGSSISLENALKSKKINPEAFISQLTERIEENKKTQNKYEDTIKITGVLPCPVKVPLLEAFEKWLKEQNFDFNLNYELKAASMGIDWIKDEMKNSENIPDLFISAGFDLFLTRTS